jgi:alkylated DNA repair dioxygenase AlkB
VVNDSKKIHNRYLRNGIQIYAGEEVPCRELLTSWRSFFAMRAADNMQLLFDVAPKFPDGFTYHPDFLSESEEHDLLKYVATLEFHPFNFHGYEGKREVASYGYDYSFEKKKIDEGKVIPDFFRPLISKVAGKVFLNENEFAELLVTRYPVGAVINWHRDAFPFELIAGISLQADCTFRLRPHEKTKQSRSSLLSFKVKRRSLYIMQGAARYDWQHSTAPVDDIRYSITLRTLKQK